MPILNLHIDEHYLKIRHWFCSDFCFEIKIYLFGSHLRFKSHYIVLGEMLYKTPLNDIKKCLKIVNKDILIFINLK